MPEPIGTADGTASADDVAALTAIAPRRAGSDAERRAAQLLRRRLEGLGRTAAIEPTRIRPAFTLTHMLHALAGVVASVVSVYAPAAGLALAAITAASAAGSLTGSFDLASMLTGSRASQNVVSHAPRSRPGLVLLAAHYDAPRGALVLEPRLRFWPRALVGSLVLIVLCCIGRAVGVDATWFTLLQFIPTVVLIVLTPLLGDASLADATDGGADNAAGVAVVLRLVREVAPRLDHFDVDVVLTGASAHFGLGMREWLRRHGHELDREATAVIAVDGLDGERPAFASKEGPLLPSRLHPALADAAAAIGLEPYVSAEMSDAYRAASAGLPALRLATLRGDEPAGGEAVDAVYDAAAELLEQIDAEIGPRLESR